MERSSVLFMLISSSTIAIPLIMGLCKLKSIPRNLYPFICFIFFFALMEFTGISLNIAYSGKVESYVNILYPYYNFYLLVEAFILTYQFKVWDAFGNNRWIYFSLLGLYILIALFESRFTNSHHYFNSYFIIGQP